MSQQSKARKIGRPKLPKGEAKGKIVPVRFTRDDMMAMGSAARARGTSLSNWIRTALFLEVKQHYKGCLIELATRSATDGGFIAFGWITTGRPISFEAPGFWVTREAAVEAGVAWCKKQIDLRQDTRGTNDAKLPE